jgi:hypothetical protein
MFSEIGDYIEEHRDELKQGLEVMNLSRDAEAQKDWHGQYDRHAAAIGFPPPKKTASKFLTTMESLQASWVSSMALSAWVKPGV